MKRFFLPLVVVLGLAGAGIYIQRQRAPHAREAATWLPAGTILFEDMPDIHRTEQRWPGTALAQMINEPEVQAFITGPLGRAPFTGDLSARLAQIRKIDPAHFFLAVTDWQGTGMPKIVLGMRFTGSKDSVEGLLADLRKSAQETWPEGKSDIQPYGAGEIETFTTPDFSAGAAYRGNWVFVATDVDLLRGMLDRYEGKTGMADSLEETAQFKSCLAHMPVAADNVFFLRPSLLADKAGSLAMMVNPTADASGADQLKKVDALGAGLKLDGLLMRDVTFIVKADPGATEALGKDSLKLSSADTIVAISERVQGLDGASLPDPKMDQTGVLQLLASYVKVFADQGLGAKELQKAFGPETGFVLDWPVGAPIPVPLALVDVQDRALAGRFLDTLTTLPLAAGVSFTRQDAPGMTLYSLPEMGFGFPLQITLGLRDKCVIAGLNPDGVNLGSRRWDAGAGGVVGTDQYLKAAALVGVPTMSFSYVDTKALFQHVYGLVRQVASMGLIPHLADYVDVGKLPQTDTIARHLSPLVSSGAVKDGGVMVESAGPVTMTEAGVAAGAVAVAVAIPTLESRLKGQTVTGFSSAGSPLSQGSSTFPAQAAPTSVVTPGETATPSGSPSAGSP